MRWTIAQRDEFVRLCEAPTEVKAPLDTSYEVRRPRAGGDE
jgi:hypothetical protein